MQVTDQTPPEATAGYFVPEQEFLKLHALRDQLTLLATLASPQQSRPSDVFVSAAALAQCYWSSVETLAATIEAATWMAPPE